MKQNAKITFWRPFENSGIEISRVSRSFHRFPNHAHDNLYALSYMEKSASYCLGADKKESFVGTRNIALFNPGQIHSGVPVGEKPISYWMLYIKRHVMTDMAIDICEKESSGPEFKRVVLDDPRISALFLHTLTRLSSRGSLMEKETVLTEFFAQLLLEQGHLKNAAPVPGKENKAISMAKEVLSENLDCKLSLPEVARHVGFSQYHLIRIFKKQTGRSPHAFRTQCRIDTARKLLYQGESFAQVALETGFTDQSHFTKTFKQYTGATPRQYIQRN